MSVRVRSARTKATRSAGQFVVAVGGVGRFKSRCVFSSFPVSEGGCGVGEDVRVSVWCKCVGLVCVSVEAFPSVRAHRLWSRKMENSDHSPPVCKAARQASSSASSASSTTTAENSLLFTSPFPAGSSSSSSSSVSSASAAAISSLSPSEFSLEQEEKFLRIVSSSASSESDCDAEREASQSQDDFHKNFKEATSIVFGAPGWSTFRHNFHALLHAEQICLKSIM